jgi:hypothetical protein
MNDAIAKILKKIAWKIYRSKKKLF